MANQDYPPVQRTSREAGNKKTENPKIFLDWTADAYLDASQSPNFQGIKIGTSIPQEIGSNSSGQRDYSSRIFFQEKVNDFTYSTYLKYDFIMFQDDKYPPEQEVSEQLADLGKELESRLSDATIENSPQSLIITKKSPKKNSVSEEWRKKVPKKIPADFFRIQDPLR